jgi:prolyl-tRNA synthetase
MDNPKVLIGLTTTKTANHSDWYRQLITKAELIEYSDVSGCYVLRPNAYAIWEVLQDFINKKIKKMGVKNAYFPMFGTKANLEAEASHLEGFSPEVAWVTKAGSSDLAEPIHVRATSETIMYPHFVNWIKSHRDLPLKINQWCSVVRWEMKACTPFIRSREFLWQEGHTCHLTKIEADSEVQEILEMYADVYEKCLAVPVIAGKKSEGEKFGGAEYTTTVECFVPVVGKAVQGATSHCLGQNFSKMFNIQVETSTGSKEFVYQNSWGITTRTLGVMTMVHADDKGMVIPPFVAPVQVVIIPCGINSKTSPETETRIRECCFTMNKWLNDHEIRCEVDDRNNYSPGYKFNYWEMRGVPIRIEIGPKDLNNNTAILYRRDTYKKILVENVVTAGKIDNFLKTVRELLDAIQSDMLAWARSERNANIQVCDTIAGLYSAVSSKQLCLVPWCENIDCEKGINEQCKTRNISAKSLCIPFDQNLAKTITGNPDKVISPNTTCFCCTRLAKSYALFGSSY